MIAFVILLVIFPSLFILLDWVYGVAWFTAKRMDFKHWIIRVKLSILEFLDDLDLL